MAKEKGAVALIRIGNDDSGWFATVDCRPDHTKAAKAMNGFSLCTETLPTKEEAIIRAENCAQLCGFEGVQWRGL
jgi:hypothetical protein